MGRFLWVWCLGWLLVVGFATNAQAGDPALAPIRVCVRPPDVPGNLDGWAYTSGLNVIGLKRHEFAKMAQGRLTYVFDVNAPPENTKYLPIIHSKLPCAPKPPPSEPLTPEPKKDEAPKPDAKKPVVMAPAPAPTPAPAPAAAPEKKEEAPEPLPPRIVYPKKDKDDEPRPRPPANGVTAQWPTTVLPIVRRDVDTTTKVLPQTTVLPVVRRDVDIASFARVMHENRDTILF